MQTAAERRQEIDDRIRARRARTGRFTRVPAKPRLSTRGERGQTWRTKKHTPSRTKDLPDTYGMFHYPHPRYAKATP